MNADDGARNAAPRGACATALRRCTLALLLAAMAPPTVAQVAVPPAEYRPASVSRKAALETELVLPRSAPSRRIALPQPTPDEAAAAKAAAQKPRSGDARLRNKKDRLLLGYARNVPGGGAAIALAALPWQATVAGTQAARIDVTSPGAAALRLSVTLVDAPPGLVVRFQGSASGALAYGPFSAAAIGEDAGYWSPALEGDTGTIEFELPAGVAPGAARVALPKLSHLLAAGRGLRDFDPNIGMAGSCEVDLACLDPALRQKLSSASKAVARMMVTIDGATFLCSGTLLNDWLASFTPYFLTADHCLEEPDDPVTGRGIAAASAGTINTYWFFEAATCGSLATPNYVLLVGGAKLLARSVDFDWALVQLKVQPPFGTTFSAWNAQGPLATGTAIDAIHHPGGDLKKFSQGNAIGYQTFTDRSSFIEALWTSGATEPGSSGSGLFTLNAAANYFELRGSLSGGSSSCANQSGIDYYARLDNAYPLLAEYLVPGAANPTKAVPVVEYYNGVQDAYFMTIDPLEIAGRDNGAPPGWVRTGYRFLAYTDPAVAPAGTQPVCRLYAPPPYGDTRFYSASAAECASMLAQSALHFLSESSAAFYVQVPNAAGACPAGTRPVYRFLDNTSPPRRRYTTEVDLRDSTIDSGLWTQEGTGPIPERVAMCAPVGGAALPVTAVANYQGLWWNSPGGSESGWGINLAHQGDIVFATWYTYDDSGNGMWLAMTAPKAAPGVFTGTLYQLPSGPAFDAMPFPALGTAGGATLAAVGTGTLTFTGDNSGSFAYTVTPVASAAAVPQVKAITRQDLGGPRPTCVFGAQADLRQATNYQDIWWAAPPGSESGWGLNLTHQGDTIFAAWFTYDRSHSPMWLVATMPKSAPGTYTGQLLRFTGPPFSAMPFPAMGTPGGATAVGAGMATLTFADGNNASFHYNVQLAGMDSAVTQTRAITRQVFAPPGTACK